MNAIVEEMADCWWMFGEGELNYAGITGKTVCAICSIVKFDNIIQETYPDGLNYEDLLEALNKPKNGKTYFQYLYPIEYVDEFIEDLYSSKIISLEEKYMIRTGIVKKGAVGQIVKKIIGDKEINSILPYFFDVNEIPDPECSEFVTKA